MFYQMTQKPHWLEVTLLEINTLSLRRVSDDVYGKMKFIFEHE